MLLLGKHLRLHHVKTIEYRIKSMSCSDIIFPCFLHALAGHAPVMISKVVIDSEADRGGLL